MDAGESECFGAGGEGGVEVEGVGEVELGLRSTVVPVEGDLVVVEGEVAARSAACSRVPGRLVRA